MPAGWGEEERFAAAMESGTTPSVGDDGSDGLARELEIAALLRSAGPALVAGTRRQGTGEAAAHGRVRRGARQPDTPTTRARSR